MEMKPGRELDALVAEKVMGYTKEPPPLSGWRNSVGYHLAADNVAAYENERLPKFSTDIRAAWEVVEKLYDWNFRLERFERLSDDYYSVGFFVRNEWHEGPDAVTAPLAICLAALKAVGAGEST